MAAAGHQTEEQLKMAVKKYKDKFICIVESAISIKDSIKNGSLF